jgi:hypothetical protein
MWQVAAPGYGSLANFPEGKIGHTASGSEICMDKSA